MKRSPLKRKTPLRSYSRLSGSRSGTKRTCARDGCEKVFYVYPSRSQRFCSKACAYASKPPVSEETKKRKSASTLGTRRGNANPNFRHGRRVDAHDRDRRRFRSGQDECQHPDCLGDELIQHQHHVVYEQKVRRVGGDRNDPRNALCVCASCHTSHHRRGSRVLPLSALRDANYAFANELLGPAAYDYLRLRYVGEDPRLDALLGSS